MDYEILEVFEMDLPEPFLFPNKKQWGMQSKHACISSSLFFLVGGGEGRRRHVWRNGGDRPPTPLSPPFVAPSIAMQNSG